MRIFERTSLQNVSCPLEIDPRIPYQKLTRTPCNYKRLLRKTYVGYPFLLKPFLFISRVSRSSSGTATLIQIDRSRESSCAITKKKYCILLIVFYSDSILSLDVERTNAKYVYITYS